MTDNSNVFSPLPLSTHSPVSWRCSHKINLNFIIRNLNPHAGGDGLYMVVDESGVFRDDNFQKAVAALNDAGGERAHEACGHLCGCVHVSVSVCVCVCVCVTERVLVWCGTRE